MASTNPLTKTETVRYCVFCPLHRNTPSGRVCWHPHLGKQPTDRLIITQKSKNSIPDQCPLREGDLIVRYSIQG